MHATQVFVWLLGLLAVLISVGVLYEVGKARPKARRKKHAPVWRSLALAGALLATVIVRLALGRESTEVNVLAVPCMCAGLFLGIRPHLIDENLIHWMLVPPLLPSGILALKHLRAELGESVQDKMNAEELRLQNKAYEGAYNAVIRDGGSPSSAKTAALEAETAWMVERGLKRAAKASEDHFRELLQHTPNLSLDQAILSFEKAEGSASLEDFAQSKMRTAEGYRRRFGPFFDRAKLPP